MAAQQACIAHSHRSGAQAIASIPAALEGPSTATNPLGSRDRRSTASPAFPVQLCLPRRDAHPGASDRDAGGGPVAGRRRRRSGRRRAAQGQASHRGHPVYPLPGKPTIQLPCPGAEMVALLRASWTVGCNRWDRWAPPPHCTVPAARASGSPAAAGQAALGGLPVVQVCELLASNAWKQVKEMKKAATPSSKARNKKEAGALVVGSPGVAALAGGWGPPVPSHQDVVVVPHLLLFLSRWRRCTSLKRWRS